LSFCTANAFENEQRDIKHINQSKNTTTGGPDFPNGMVNRVKLRQCAKFRGDRSNRRRDMAIFRFFSRWRPPPNQDSDHRHLGYLKFLTVARLKMLELRRHAKFGRNRSNRSRDMAIFRFVQDGSRPPSWICYVCVRTTHEGHLVVFIAVENKKKWLESMQ